MERLRLYFLRHGQTTASKEDRFSGARFEAELTEAGLTMAAQFAEQYGDQHWLEIYCSPQKRASDTAAPISTRQGVVPSVRQELKEIDYGVWDGKTKDEVMHSYHDDFLRWNADPAWNAPTKGETALQVARRARTLLEEVRLKYSTGSVLLVSHKATIRIMLCDLLGIDLSRFRDRLACPVASISVVEFGNRGPLLVRLADVSYQSRELQEEEGT